MFRRGFLTASLIVFMLISGFNLCAQVFFDYETINYQVTSDESEATAKEIAIKMESALKLYNDTFHLDLSALKAKYRVIVFRDKIGFDAYLNNILGETREDFAYIHYTDPNKCELVIYKKTKDFHVSLLHQGFVQFIKSFIQNPPIWLREGAAAYFEASPWQEDKKNFIFRANRVWLTPLKKIIKAQPAAEGAPVQALIPLEVFLSMDYDTAKTGIQTFYPQAWGLVTFLLESPQKKYNRIFWDSLSSLGPQATLLENSQGVIKKAFNWVEMLAFTKDFIAYIDSIKTYPELINLGIAQYAEKKYKESEASFLEAMGLKPADYIPYYYLGLINYETENFFKAEEYYLKALELGAEPGLTNYALGVNSFANNQIDKARFYLNEAVKVNPAYKEKAATILKRMETLK